MDNCFVSGSAEFCFRYGMHILNEVCFVCVWWLGANVHPSASLFDAIFEYLFQKVDFNILYFV